MLYTCHMVYKQYTIETVCVSMVIHYSRVGMYCIIPPYLLVLTDAICHGWGHLHKNKIYKSSPKFCEGSKGEMCGILPGPKQIN